MNTYSISLKEKGVQINDWATHVAYNYATSITLGPMSMDEE